jgi:2,5-dioxopentanoate dehydrogenase
VVAKAHPSHLGTSELAGRAIQNAVRACGLPPGTFSLLVGAGNEAGAALVQHPAIQAVGFTGSRRGGRALLALAQARPVPIPVFAEMSSTNPVFLFPEALAARGAAIAAGLVASATLGVGQFCTKPGLVFGVEGPALEAFAAAAAAAVGNVPGSTMLNAGIHAAYTHGLDTLRGAAGVEQLAASEGEQPPYSGGQPAVFRTSAAALLVNPALAEEVFGPATLLVGCQDADEMLRAGEALEGQLTATLHLDAADLALAQRFLPVLERKAGRLLVNGFPTGVEVSYAMVHGGPHPATSDARVTSVGAMAIERFLRPVCYQDFPQALLPTELQDAHLGALPRLVDGKLQLP